MPVIPFVIHSIYIWSSCSIPPFDRYIHIWSLLTGPDADSILLHLLFGIDRHLTHCWWWWPTSLPPGVMSISICWFMVLILVLLLSIDVGDPGVDVVIHSLLLLILSIRYSMLTIVDGDRWYLSDGKSDVIRRMIHSIHSLLMLLIHLTRYSRWWLHSLCWYSVLLTFVDHLLTSIYC